jgi:hypothetical protein
MPLHSFNAVLHYIKMYRVAHIDGRYGGGKTSFAFRCAYELLTRGGYRYLFSNVASVWNDNPDEIVMRDGRYVDAVVVLDEGGLFLKTGRDVEKFLVFLRKLNITLLLPSVQRPASALCRLQVQRMSNLNVLGLPLWSYVGRLSSGDQNERSNFYWRNPKEIYGIYDTLGVPTDDTLVYLADGSDAKSIMAAGSLEGYMNEWVKQLAQSTGYKNTAARNSGGGFVDEFASTGGAANGAEALAEPTGFVAALLEASETNLEAANISARAARDMGKTRRKKGLFR